MVATTDTEMKASSPNSAERHPASQDADELQALLSQVRREGARTALKEAITKLKAMVPKSTPATFPRSVPSQMKATLKSMGTPPIGEEEIEWKSIEKFYYSDSGYDNPIVTVYIDLPGVIASKNRVTCNFTAQRFDLQVRNHNGVNYRMVKEPLEKDVVPEECKTIVKKNQIKIKLKKKKGDYSYESWTRLIAKGGKRKDFSKDPSQSLMSMMKDMYDEGDDNTKKLIGEAMLKSRMGQTGLDKDDKFGMKDDL